MQLITVTLWEENSTGTRSVQGASQRSARAGETEAMEAVRR